MNNIEGLSRQRVGRDNQILTKPNDVIVTSVLLKVAGQTSVFTTTAISVSTKVEHKV